MSRARDIKEVKNIFKSNNRNGDHFKSINEAINHVKNISDNNDIIFVGGSTFVVSELIASIIKK